MENDRKPRVKLPGQIDIELASDGDAMKQWEDTEGEAKSLRANISLRAAWIAGNSRPQEADDSIPTSDN